MRVQIESARLPSGALVQQARILDGYREGQMLRSGDTENLVYHFSRALFVAWLQTTGYEVVNPVE
jgi:hypothetical protein